jgi:hypothetical protein
MTASYADVNKGYLTTVTDALNNATRIVYNDSKHKIADVDQLEELLASLGSGAETE